MAQPVTRQDIAKLRRFNRFYTSLVGALQDRLLDSDLNLPEVRVLYELANVGKATSSNLAKSLGLDAGYLSRLVSKLEKRHLLERRPDQVDGRAQWLELTRKGKDTFAELDERSQAEVRALLEGVPPSVKAEVLAAAFTIESAFGADQPRAPLVLRGPGPGDLGWVVQRHGAIYAADFGWYERFEAHVARIVAEFAGGANPAKEACWIADIEGEPVGSVFLLRKDDLTAQLRLLLVEPRARGRGVGRSLVNECLRFASRKGYRAVELWTHDVLVAARKLYEEQGFELVERQTHDCFGPAIEGETWRLALA
jgi:DNA-binding MarR family transcriptional regulator/predicted N-acetyltransferase YhbS